MSAGPVPAPARSAVDDCVHCGFCLPTCPTWVSWGHEADSPRGRIHLLRGVEEGAFPLGPDVARHFDRCLGCMACVTSCPSGVRFDLLLGSARARIEAEVARPAAGRRIRRLVFALFPYPGRLRALLPFLWLWQKSGLSALVARLGLLGGPLAALGALEALAPPVTVRHLTATLPEVTPASGPRRLRVGLLGGCVQKIFFPSVHEATLRVLAAEGVEVVVPPAQGCCGALSAHSGRDEEARRMARELIAAFEPLGVDRIVVNAAGCGSAMKEYGRLLADDPAWAARAGGFAAKVRDVTEVLSELPAVAPRHPIDARVAFHDPCHLAHAQGVRSEPRALLSAIPGLVLVEIPDGEQCCGSAGTFNLLQPEAAREIGERKADNVLQTRPDLLASANPGCTLQVGQILRRRGVDLPAAHPVEILDASIAGRTFPGTRGAPR